MYQIFAKLLFVLILLLIISLCLPAKALTAAELSAKARDTVKSKCMDCHSTHTVLPFYAQWPLVKDLIQADITKGLDHFDIGKEIDVLEDNSIAATTLTKLEAVVKAGSMPPLQYSIAHWDKTLTKENKATLLQWIKALRGESLEALSEPETLNLDPAKVELGSKLFHDTRLSRDNTISCASCHDLAKGGTDQQQYSTGIGGAQGHINSPTVYNSSYNFKQFWDGRSDNLVTQAAGPVHNPLEMGSNWNEVISKLKQDPDYEEAFKSVYGTDKISGELIADAIASFESSLVTPSRFDDYLLGNAHILSQAEIQGYELFQKYRCDTCHLGPSFGGKSFEKMGLAKDYFADRAKGLNKLQAIQISKEDYGRYNVTRNETDRFKFKVPTLRNVELTYPYFHDGSVNDLQQAVRIMAEYQVGKKISGEESHYIAEFLRSLTGSRLESLR